MPTVRIYNFNNYYNRKYKVYDNLESYGDPIYVETGSNVNFNPNDGVNTQYTAGRQMNAYNGKGDYLIYSQDNTSITSRWFILEQSYTRLGQYILTIRRDVLADNPSWLKSETFIEKCTLSPYSPFIYNDENMSFNEIKKEQTPIYDDTGIPWIVGFYASNLTMGTHSIPADRPYDIELSGTASDLKAKIESTQYWDSNTYYYSYIQNYDTLFEVYNGINVLTGETRYKNFTPDPYGTNLAYKGLVTSIDSSAFNKNKMDDLFKSQYSSNYDFDGINQYLNKTIKLSDGYYNVTIYQTTVTSVDSRLITGTDLWAYFNSRWEKTNFFIYNSASDINSYAARVTTTYKKYLVYVNKLEDGSITFGIDNTAIFPSDIPYRAFAMPFGTLQERPISPMQGSPVNVTGDTEFLIANYLNSIKSTDSDAFELIDCQIVPYCPVKELTIGGTPPQVRIRFSNSKIAFPIKKNDEIIGYMFALSACDGTFSKILTDRIEVSDPKVQNQTEKYRLCAGNYTSAFDFNVAKNGGLEGYNISYSYKPFNSYIKVSPIFRGLYGENFKDGRGLICGGMSLAKVNDAFNQYRLQNKYYQDIFDRQIQNMEVSQKYQRLQQGLSAGVGALGAGVGAGTLTGNIGIGVGAGIVSGAGGIADYQITKALQNEALDYTKDNFGYNLQNIKAQPNTLSRTADYNIDTQYVPFLEYYSCSNEEKDAFINKLRFNGMTAMFIDIPEKYTTNTYTFKESARDYNDLGFFKGIPIRLEDISDDYHMAKAVAEELNKGVYMK